MADKKLESITFPDLPDRYVVKPDIADVTGLQTALDGKADVEDFYNAFVTESLTGSIASFTDGADDIPVKSLVAEIVPLQSGSGDPSPDNVRAISGWSECNVSVACDNLFGGIEVVDAIQQNFANVVVDTANKSFHYSPTSAEGYVQVIGIVYKGKHFPFKENTQYTFIIRVDKDSANDALNLGVAYTDGTNNGGFWKSQADADGWIVFTTPEGKSVRNLYGGLYVTTSTEIFYNDFGIFEGVVTKEDFVPYNGETHTISFASAGTVYGGSIDVTTGVLTVDRGYATLDPTWNWADFSLGGNMVQFYVPINPLDNYVYKDDFVCDCNRLKPILIAYRADNGNNESIYFGSSGPAVRMDNTTVDGFKSWITNNETKFTYPLATPQTYQLTPTEVKTLLGNNNVWADTGDIDLTYRADLGLYLDKIINA